MKKRTKKLISMSLASIMALSLAGCGGSSGVSDSSKKEGSGDAGKTLNIWCWNDEFQSRFNDYYPEVEKVSKDKSTTTLKDGTVVKWTINPNENNNYQNKLDEALLNQEKASADDKIDIFLIEADYALKYVDSDYTMDIKDLGLTDDDLSEQYQYTKDIVTVDGTQKGTTWQATPGLFAYRRSIAKDVLGTDDPEQVQAAVADWDKFNAVAEKANEKGYKMLSGYDDAYRTFSNNVAAPWVDGKTVKVDENIMKWVDDSKAQVDAGETGTCDLWSDDWSKGFYPQGKVFCYFGPAWLVNFSMAADTEGSIGYNGGWGAAQGPQGFFWGGTWICAAQGTDNASLVKDIMLKMTTDDDIMKDIVVDDDDFVNNSTVMNGLADGSIKVKDDKEYTSKILGGQNPLPMYCAGVETLDLSNLSSYDQGCNEEFQNAMKNYFEGKASKEDALDLFYKAVTEKYPELTY